MPTTSVVNLYKEPYDVYIGRAKANSSSLWGNPFVIGKDGNRADVINKYEVFIKAKLADGTIPLTELMKLKGKRLGCFCKPQACHGDVLVKLIEANS